MDKPRHRPAAPGTVARSTTLRRCLVWFSLAAACLANAALAQPAARIKIGATLPLSGPNANYGQGLQQGLRLGLAPLLQGGVDGQAVELIALDDAGDPQRSGSNARQLLEQGAVALTALHGARAFTEITALLQKHQVPLVGVASSSEAWRDADLRWVFNLRAAASEELGAIVYHLDTLGLQRVGALFEEGSLGRSGAEGLQVELSRLGMRPQAMESLPTGTDEKALAPRVTRLCAGAPEAVLLAVDTRIALSAVKQARSSGCGVTQFVLLSETGAALSGNSTGADVRGVVIAQVLPHPSKIAHPLVAAYQRALASEPGLSASYPSLEGYLYGRVLTETLRICSKRSKPACIAETLEGRPPNLAGWPLKFPRGERRGTGFVELVYFDRDGRMRH